MPEVRVLDAQPDIGHGEIGVEFNGALHERNGLSIALRAPGGNAHAISFQSFQRRCGCLHRDIELLDGGQGFTKFSPQRRGRRAKRLQHVLLRVCLLLFSGQRISAVASDGVQANHVLASQVGNRPEDDRLAARPNTKFPRHIAGDPLCRGTAHQTQRFFDSAVGENIEEW